MTTLSDLSQKMRLERLHLSSGIGRALAGALVLSMGLGAGNAMASPRHHRHVVPQDFNAYVEPGFAASGPSIGTWRFRTFRNGGCDRSYPMHEASPCGSATGGPVGGMGS